MIQLLNNYFTVADLAGEALVLGTDAEWPTFRRIVVEVIQNHGQVLNFGQEASTARRNAWNGRHDLDDIEDH